MTACTITEEFYILDNTAAEDTVTTSLEGTNGENSITITPNPARKSFRLLRSDYSRPYGLIR